MTNSKVWIVGAKGQLGMAISSHLDRLEFEILNTDKDDVDITDNKEVIRFGDSMRPETIINCAGLTDMKECERDPEKAYLVNAIGARNLSISARKTGAKLIHLSTDDVFGEFSLEPKNEFDPPSPTTVYGRSKLAGENFIREFATKHMIIRSSWIYGKGNDFVNNLLALAKEEKPIPVAKDQFGSPTSAEELANFIIFLLHTSEYGLYHGVCSGSCSRVEFAQEILRLAGLTSTILPVETKDAALTADRPSHCVLDNFMLRISKVYQMSHWKTALADYMQKGKEL